MDEATRLLSVAVTALWKAAKILVPVEFDLAMDVQGAAVETDAVLAMIGSVDW